MGKKKKKKSTKTARCKKRTRRKVKNKRRPSLPTHSKQRRSKPTPHVLVQSRNNASPVYGIKKQNQKGGIFFLLPLAAAAGAIASAVPTIQKVNRTADQVNSLLSTVNKYVK